MRIDEEILDDIFIQEGLFGVEGALITNVVPSALPPNFPIPKTDDIRKVVRYIKEKELIQDGLRLLMEKPERSQIRYHRLYPSSEGHYIGTYHPIELTIDLRGLAGHLIYRQNNKDVNLASFALKIPPE